jgi:hypothetical protein
MERMALRARRTAELYTGRVDEGLRGVLAGSADWGDEEQRRSQDDSVLSQISTKCVAGLGSVVCFYLFE